MDCHWWESCWLLRLPEASCLEVVKHEPEMVECRVFSGLNMNRGSQVKTPDSYLILSSLSVLLYRYMSLHRLSIVLMIFFVLACMFFFPPWYLNRFNFHPLVSFIPVSTYYLWLQLQVVALLEIISMELIPSLQKQVTLGGPWVGTDFTWVHLIYGVSFSMIHR